MASPSMGVDSWRRDPRSGWVALALGALGAFVVFAFLATAWPVFRGLDGVVSAAIRATRNPLFTGVAPWVTEIGSLQVAMSAALLLIIWMAVRRNWAAVVYVFMTVGVGWFLGNDVIKNIIRRPRPVGVNIAPITEGYSLPSGHSLASFLFFTTLCVIVMLNLPTGRHVKRWLAAVSALLIVAVGYSRVYLGVHWAGDVLAAWLLGGAWWLFTTATYFGSVTEEKRVAPRPGGSTTDSE